MTSLRETFLSYAKEGLDKCCIIDPQGREWSRREVLRGISFVQADLKNRGIVAGSVVGLICPNGAEFLMTYLGCVFSGVSVAPINWHLTSNELSHITAVAQPSILFVHQKFARRVGASIPEVASGAMKMLTISDGETVDLVFRNLTSAICDEIVEPPILGRTLLFTSATTGRPKAVILSRGNGYGALQRTIAFHKALGAVSDSNDRHMCASMLYHSSPLDGVLTTLHMGNVAVLMEKWDARGALALIAKHRVRVAFMVPIMLIHLSRIPEHERVTYDLSSLRMIMHAGAPCSREAKKHLMEWLGPVIYESYGATEGAGTYATPEEWLEYPGTVGRPMPGARIEVRDDSGRLVAAEVEGLVYIRPYTGDRFEYLNDEAATKACYMDDMFTAGDVGFLNKQGLLFLKDRRVDLILCGGANVYPAEIEEQIMCHPDIQDCAVVGRFHPSLGQSIHACVSIVSGVSHDVDSIKQQLVRLLHRRLAANKLPHSFEIVAEIPRDPNGKLLRRMLKKPMESDGS